MLVLLLGLGWTLGAKSAVVWRRKPDHLLRELLEAGLCDVAFFAAIACLGALLYFVGRPRLTSRVSLLVATVLLLWSVANAAWLVASGVQLQPGVLGVIAREPSSFLPIVQAHLVAKPALSIPLGGTAVIAVLWIAWRFVRPTPVIAGRGWHAVGAATAGVVCAAALAGHAIQQRAGSTAYSGQVIAFSSHWYALLQTLRDVSPDSDVDRSSRRIPRVRERRITAPPPGAPRPNVLVVFLESVSHDATSFAGSDAPATPCLERLAAEGTTFARTHVPVPLTSKAWWAGLTGVTPDIHPDNAETVLADVPYEGLASVLGRHGYRSAFFQMAKGSFECAPGLFANLAFDWAWFRENLEDESAHLGYMNGDDFRMLDPMMSWVDEDDAPFLLVTITSVAHDPYVLPDWYEHEATDDTFERYLQTVEFSDAFLCELLDRLDGRDLLENTVVCVIGDHGEGFRPESRSGRYVPYEEVLRVPWVVRWPAGVEAGRRVEWPCSQLDVTPTLLSLLGFGVDDAGMDGVDALQPQPAERRLFFSSWYRNAPLGYREGNRKLVYWPYTDKLYEHDLDGDPGEQTPVLVTGPEREEVLEQIDSWARGSRIEVEARRFRRAMLYDHWRAFSDGRFAQAYYVP
jgi:arylsulfatase A-like enzyme